MAGSRARPISLPSIVLQREGQADRTTPTESAIVTRPNFLFRFPCRLAGTAIATLCALPMASCGLDDSGLAFDAPEAGPETLFLVQGRPADAVMDALHEGAVVRDGGGCLRLGGPDPATVVWPFGFRLVSDGGALIILDADDRTVGRIGDAFRLGGGEVSFLYDQLGLSDEVRRQAERRCSGRYWIVGEVY